MAGEWWHNDAGDNLLKGVEGEVDNPIRLEDDYIIDFLQRIQPARDSFNRLVPSMLIEEQVRLNAIAEGLAQLKGADYKEIEDNFQKSQNTVGIHTSGPRGGGGWSPPPMQEP